VGCVLTWRRARVCQPDARRRAMLARAAPVVDGATARLRVGALAAAEGYDEYAALVFSASLAALGGVVAGALACARGGGATDATSLYLVFGLLSLCIISLVGELARSAGGREVRVLASAAVLAAAAAYGALQLPATVLDIPIGEGVADAAARIAAAFDGGDGSGGGGGGPPPRLWVDGVLAVLAGLVALLLARPALRIGRGYCSITNDAKQSAGSKCVQWRSSSKAPACFGGVGGACLAAAMTQCAAAGAS
jgi:hypothetical protein